MTKKRHSTKSDGRLSRMGLIVRIELALLGVMILALVTGGIAVLRYRADRDEPLALPLYPGAELVFEETVREGFDHRQYTTPDAMELVEAFYRKQPGLTCEQQFPADPDSTGSMSTAALRYTRCYRDRSGWGMIQSIAVLIQPIRGAQAGLTESVLIDVQRQWGH